MSLIIILLFQKILQSKCKFGVYTSVFVSFCSMGSLLFMLFESRAFVQSQLDVLDAKERVLKKYGNASAEALTEFIEELKDLGFRGLPNKDGTVREWGFSDALYFVVTLLTTVGYGHYAPKTIIGKAICIMYLIMGIPITLVFLAYYVGLLLKQSDIYKAFLFRNYQHACKPFTLRLFHFSSITCCLVLACFIVPAIIFTYTEKNWNFLEGLYFCFISLTTVGLGDMVPALDPEGPNSDIYKISVSLYLIIGVTLVMFLMALFGDFQRNYNSPYDTPLPYTIATEKVPINPGDTPTYGSVVTESGESGKSELGEKNKEVFIHVI